MKSKLTPFMQKDKLLVLEETVSLLGTRQNFLAGLNTIFILVIIALVREVWKLP